MLTFISMPRVNCDFYSEIGEFLNCSYGDKVLIRLVA